MFFLPSLHRQARTEMWPSVQCSLFLMSRLNLSFSSHLKTSHKFSSLIAFLDHPKKAVVGTGDSEVCQVFALAANKRFSKARWSEKNTKLSSHIHTSYCGILFAHLQNQFLISIKYKTADTSRPVLGSNAAWVEYIEVNFFLVFHYSKIFILMSTPVHAFQCQCVIPMFANLCIDIMWNAPSFCCTNILSLNI